MDPARVLEAVDGPPPVLPCVPGWKLLAAAGEGGMGMVWRAVRDSDGAVAAVKLAPGRDQNTVERIEAEGAALRALEHANIVRLLELGPLEDGGLFLAMQFIAGGTLAHSLPFNGLAPAKAFSLFGGIAAGVAHAHERGILHRDLKPANILLVEGTASVPMVADFGLARPVHERVERLSLTQTGLIAGTVEYLPPEAYIRGYTATTAGDVYALGVILFEMLVGAPPRGAWEPVSQQRHVDVRVDEVLQRAMHPDRAQRWSSVREMSAALDAIHASPPRYAGSPLVTLATRAADAAWSVLGFLVGFVTLCTLIRMDKKIIPVPVDLIGAHNANLGGFQALVFILQALIPLCAWQLVRLWRFRRVPLREALPSPLGLRLGVGRTAAVLVGAGQLLCFVLPVVLLFTLYLDCGTKWVRSGDAPWAHGLTVTQWTGKEPLSERELNRPHSPWDWPRSDRNYWLKQVTGPPDLPTWTQHDRISFLPFYVPAEMVAIAALSALTLLCTLLAALHGWAQQRRWAQATAVAVLALLATISSAQAWREEVAVYRKSAVRDAKKGGANFGIPRAIGELHRHLAKLGSEDRKPLPPELLALYADGVDYRTHGKITQARVAELNAADCALAAKQHRTIIFQRSNATERPQHRDGERWRVEVLSEWQELTDPEDGALASVAYFWIRHIVEFSVQSADEDVRILHESLGTNPAYFATPRPLSMSEAVEWHRLFTAALATPHPPAASAQESVPATEPLLPSFHKSIAHGLDRDIGPGTQDGTLTAPRAPTYTLKWLIFTLRHAPPMQTAGPLQPGIQRLAGARSRILFPMREEKTGAALTFTADLASIEGQWRCVQLFYEPTKP